MHSLVPAQSLCTAAAAARNSDLYLSSLHLCHKRLTSEMVITWVVRRLPAACDAP